MAQDSYPLATTPVVALMSIAAGSGARNSAAFDLYGCTNFQAQFTVLGGSGTGNIQLQFSPDGVTWTAGPGYIDYGNSGGWPASAISYSGLTTNLGTIYTGPVWARYVRLFTSVTTTGTYTMALTATQAQGMPSRVIPQTIIGNSLPIDSTADNGGTALPVVGFTMGYIGGASSVWTRVRTPNVFKIVQAGLVGNNTLWTPAAGRRFRLMKYRIMIANGAIGSANSYLTMQFKDATTNLPLVESCFLTTTASNVAGNAWTTGLVDLGNGYLSSGANQTLYLSQNYALTDGDIRVLLIGTEE